MFRRGAAVTCALAVLFALSACSDSNSATKRSSASASSAPDTTTTTAPTTTTTVALSPAGSAQDAATTFVTAWRNGDRATALSIALPTAVDAVFNAGDPGSLQNRGCNHPPSPDSPVLCVYKSNVGEVQVRSAPRPDGWIVDQAIVSPA
jgi:hypothetical protein